MSIGYHGFAKLYSEDDDYVCYAYSGANLNDQTRNKEADYYYDGRFRIDKKILERIKMLSEESNQYISLTYIAIKEGYLIIDQECQNAFLDSRRNEYPIDYIILRLLSHVFQEMFKSEEGCLTFPEKVAFLQ